MCKAFSAIVLESGKVLWQMGIDSHDDLLRKFGIADKDIKPNFARIEISPDNGNYLKPDKWTFKLDEQVVPPWWNPIYEKYAHDAHKEWLKKLNRILVKKPIVHPFRDVKPPKKITKKHLSLLKQWDSVRASVRDSVWDSLWASVGDSLWASVRAYIGSFFRLPRKSWKYTENIKCKGYPFQSAVDLWMMGLVPSYDGKVWQLHGGLKADVLWRGEIEEKKNGSSELSKSTSS